MKISQIKELALNEIISDPLRHERVIRMFTDLTHAKDVTVESSVEAEAIEAVCDKQKLPCYVVSEDCIAIAPTYFMLFEHERGR